jgi:DNA-binding NarL/FixJ family response regulator
MTLLTTGHWEAVPVTLNTIMNKPKIDLLSERELQTLTLLADGLEYNEIASMMLISINGVRANIKSIYRKFQVNNSVQASRVYWEHQYGRVIVKTFETNPYPITQYHG